MPVFHNPKLAIIEPRGGGLPWGALSGVAVAGAAGGGAWWVIDRLAEFTGAIEAGVGVVAVTAAVGTALFMRREFRRVPAGIFPGEPAALRAEQAKPVAAPARQQIAVTQVVSVTTNVGPDYRAAGLAAEVAALRAQVDARPVENHLHLHGISPAEVAAAIEARKTPLYEIPVTEYHAIEETRK